MSENVGSQILSLLEPTRFRLDARGIYDRINRKYVRKGRMFSDAKEQKIVADLNRSHRKNVRRNEAPLSLAKQIERRKSKPLLHKLLRIE